MLRTGSLKWSNPLEFNDPFDNQFGLDVDNDLPRLARELSDSFVDRITGKAPITGHTKTSQALEWMRANLKKPITPEYREEIYERTLAGLTGPDGRPPRLYDRLRDYLLDISVFCVSEKHDDILMWSHYAQNHAGAVVKFLCVEGSPLTMAQRVMYSAEFPVIRASDLFDIDTLPEKALTLITLTKSSHWEYEQEWRVITTARDKAKSFEFLPFNKRELGAVYLGCRMKDADKSKMIGLVREKYPWAEIYQAGKNEKRFALDFNVVA